MTGDLEFLENGRNIAFRIGKKPDGTAIYRSEDSHTLARWFMKSSTHPFTREKVSIPEKKRVFRKALATKNKGNSFTQLELGWMQSFLTRDRSKPPSPLGRPSRREVLAARRAALVSPTTRRSLLRNLM